MIETILFFVICIAIAIHTIQIRAIRKIIRDHQSAIGAFAEIHSFDWPEYREYLDEYKEHLNKKNAESKHD